jgi:hypothetical protein
MQLEGLLGLLDHLLENGLEFLQIDVSVVVGVGFSQSVFPFLVTDVVAAE